MDQKIKSVNELARFKVGESLYWVAFRPVTLPHIPIKPDDQWMASCHPKVLYDRRIASKGWHYKCKMPKLCAVDFQYVVDLLTSEPIVERFAINGLCRSTDTGEFYYVNEVGEWMPESYLFTTAQAAKREKRRIKDLFKAWSDQASEDEV